MKKFFSLFFAITIMYGALPASDWMSIDRSLYEYKILDVEIQSKDNIVAVGAYGSIYKIYPEQSQEVVYIQASDQWGTLNDVVFADGRFYAAGQDGLLFRSNSDGTVWNELKTGIDEDIIAVGMISGEIFLVSSSSIYHMDGTGESITVYSGTAKYNSAIFENGRIYGVGEQGSLFTYNPMSGYTEHDSKVESNISTIFSDDQGLIYYTPDQSFVHRSDPDLNSIDSITVYNPISRVLSAEIDHKGRLLLEGVFDHGYHIAIDTSSKQVTWAWTGENRGLWSIESKEGLTVYVGNNALVGYIKESEAEEEFNGFRRTTHRFRQSLYNDQLLYRNGMIENYGLGSFFELNSEWKNDTLINRPIDRYIGEYNGRRYFFRQSWRPQGNNHTVLSYFENGEVIDVDSTSVGAQKISYLETEDSFYSYSTAFIFRVDKTTLETEEILTGGDTGIIQIREMTFGDGIFYAISVDSIYSSKNTRDWEVVGNFENASFKNPTLHHTGERLLLIGNFGLGDKSTVYVHDVIKDENVYSYFTGNSIKSVIADDDFIGMTSNFDNIAYYSFDGGTNWTIDTISNAENLLGVFDAGDYMVAYSYRDILIKPSPLASINENPSSDYSEDINLYPNPASDKVNIGTDKRLLNAKVISINGKSISLKVSENTIDVNPLAEGSYILILEFKNDIQVRNLIIRYD